MILREIVKEEWIVEMLMNRRIIKDKRKKRF